MRQADPSAGTHQLVSNGAATRRTLPPPADGTSADSSACVWVIWSNFTLFWQRLKDAGDASVVAGVDPSTSKRLADRLQHTRTHQIFGDFHTLKGWDATERNLPFQTGSRKQRPQLSADPESAAGSSLSETAARLGQWLLPELSIAHQGPDHGQDAQAREVPTPDASLGDSARSPASSRTDIMSAEWNRFHDSKVIALIFACQFRIWHGNGCANGRTS